jgi:hypothetical protein
LKHQSKNSFQGEYIGSSFYHDRKLVEKFQDTIAVASGAASETLPALPENVIKETCNALKIQLDQYKGVKQQYPDTEIRNLDETLKILNKHYRDRACYKYE